MEYGEETESAAAISANRDSYRFGRDTGNHEKIADAGAKGLHRNHPRYAHDFSEFLHLELGADGRFGYTHLPLYWSELGRHPFLVRMDGKLAGLVLVKRGSEISDNESVWDMAEFFVIRGYRRRGIGTQIAHEVWRRFPGLWEVRVVRSNHLAHQFWERAIAAFTSETIHSVRVEKGGDYWRVFSFESRRVA